MPPNTRWGERGHPYHHSRRKVFELADVEAAAIKKARGEKPKPVSPLALEAVQRIDALFAIEREINGLTPAVVQLKVPGAPMADIYQSVAKFGVGQTIWAKIATRDPWIFITGSTNITRPDSGNARIYQMNMPAVMEDFNLYFGAKAVPVMSPTFRAGTAVPATIAAVSPLGGPAF